MNVNYERRKEELQWKKIIMPSMMDAKLQKNREGS